MGKRSHPGRTRKVAAASAYDPAVASPPRCAILPPVPVPYRQPLFARLADRARIAPTIVYLSGGQPGWDQHADWFSVEHDYPVRILGARQRARPGRSPVLLPRGLGRALDEVDPDCVVSWEFGAATMRSLAWCRRRGRPLVIFSELTPEAARELSPIRRTVHRLLAPRAAGFIAASSRARDRIVGLGVDAERVEVSLQSADVERFRAVARREHAGPARVLSAGRLVPDKNLGLLIEAFAEAGLAQGEAELELCGSGPLEGELRAAAERLGVPLRLRGYASPGELPEVYAQADVFALVSTYEPFGVAVREAAAAGLPIVCTRAAGAAPDVAREGENALLVDPRDRGQVAAAIRRLVRDGELRGRMGEASRAITDALSPEADAEAFERAVLRAAGQA
jgi:glycosyltransferase involved in cell wall biosynthesis